MKASLLVRSVAIVFCSFACCGVTHSEQGGALADTANISTGVARKAILLAVENGAPGEEALRAWSTYANELGSELPPVWVVCRTQAMEASVLLEPPLKPLAVHEKLSWANVLKIFSWDQSTSLLGLFGEGSLPHPDLSNSIKALGVPLSTVEVPAAVIPRSRAASSGGGGGEWLPDTFVSQVWVNRATLDPSRLVKTGLDESLVQDFSLLDVLPLVVLKRRGDGVVLVDGTAVLDSVFEVDGSAVSSLPVARDARGGGVYIGALALAALHLKGGKNVAIARAPWPPRCVLRWSMDGS